MLVLTRKAGESVRVGAGIRITVVSTSRGHVRLGIEAPERIPVYREEVYERIAEANRRAADTADLQLLAEIPAPGSQEGKP